MPFVRIHLIPSIAIKTVKQNKKCSHYLYLDLGKVKFHLEVCIHHRMPYKTFTVTNDQKVGLF